MSNKDKLIEAVNIAIEFADIALDWNFDEAEIYGKMTRTRDLRNLFKEALIDNTSILPENFAPAMPDNWADVLDDRANAEYLQDSEGTIELLRATAQYIRGTVTNKND